MFLIRNLMISKFALPVIAGVGAAFFLFFGLWPLIDPMNFYEEVADFPPYNEHFLHDIGAFQVGLGLTLLLALFWRSDALLVALIGSGVAAALHVWAHIADEDQGGSSGDTIFLAILAVLLLAGAAWQWTRSKAV
jgi:hypothetical protein